MKLILEGSPGTCPVCKEDASHLCDEYANGEHMDSYTCRACGLIVTFITPDTKRPYHEYNSARLEIETTVPRVRFDMEDEQ